MKMCNDNWSIRVDWPLKHVNKGRRKVKKKPIFLPNLLSFMSLTAKRRFCSKVREFVIWDNFKRLSDNNEDNHEYKCFINRFWTT